MSLTTILYCSVKFNTKILKVSPLLPRSYVLCSTGSWPFPDLILFPSKSQKPSFWMTSSTHQRVSLTVSDSSMKRSQGGRREQLCSEWGLEPRTLSWRTTWGIVKDSVSSSETSWRMWRMLQHNKLNFKNIWPFLHTSWFCLCSLTVWSVRRNVGLRPKTDHHSPSYVLPVRNPQPQQL